MNILLTERGNFPLVTLPLEWKPLTRDQERIQIYIKFILDRALNYSLAMQGQGVPGFNSRSVVSANLLSSGGLVLIELLNGEYLYLCLYYHPTEGGIPTTGWVLSNDQDCLKATKILFRTFCSAAYDSHEHKIYIIIPIIPTYVVTTSIYDLCKSNIVWIPIPHFHTPRIFQEKFRNFFVGNYIVFRVSKVGWMAMEKVFSLCYYL